MTQIDYERLTAAELGTDPFDYLVVPGCIPPAALAEINRDYPAIDHAGNCSVEDLSYGPAFRRLLEEVEGPEFAAAIGAKFSLDLAHAPTTVTVRKYCEQSDGNIHTDHKSKVITVLFYFNEHWSGSTGQLRLLRSNHDLEDFAAEVPPLGGTLLAFRRTDHSWHGHHPFVGERRMIQVNFLRSDTLSLLKQRIDRFGTRTMKRALRVIGGG